MPVFDDNDYLDALSAPLGDVIASVGRGVGQAQMELDAGSLQTLQEVYSDDRDLWHVNLAASPPARTRAHSGANVGFGGAVSWSGDGTRLACRFTPLSGHATLAGFTGLGAAHGGARVDEAPAPIQVALP